MCKTHSFVITVDSLKHGSYRPAWICQLCCLWTQTVHFFIHMWLLLTVRLLQVHIYKPLHTLLLCGRKED